MEYYDKSYSLVQPLPTFVFADKVNAIKKSISDAAAGYFCCRDVFGFLRNCLPTLL